MIPAAGRHRARREQHVLRVGSNTNWVIAKDGDSCTLVDSGDREVVLSSLAALGLGSRDVAAGLVTHAHNDHIGAAEYLRGGRAVPPHAP